jgi:tetratricopeptide (TPR) repeat protein
MEATTKQLYIFSFIRAFSYVAHGERKDGDEALNLFSKGSKLYAQSLESHPGDALAYNNYAVALYHIGNTSRNFSEISGRTEILKGNVQLATKTLKQCSSLYSASVSISKPSDPILFQRYFSWSAALKQLGSLHSSNLLQSQSFFSLSQEKLEKALVLQPNSYEVHDNYGLLLANWGQILGIHKKNEDAQEKFVKAQLEFDQAKKIMPKKVEAFINSGLAFQYWANVFFLEFSNVETQSTTNKPQQSELFTKCYGQYELATELDPENPNLFFNWAIGLIVHVFIFNGFFHSGFF